MNKQKRIESTEKELKNIERKVEQIYADKLNGLIVAEDFSKFYNSYQEQKEKKVTKICELKKKYDEANNEKIIKYKEIKKLAEKCIDMEELEPE